MDELLIIAGLIALAGSGSAGRPWALAVLALGVVLHVAERRR